MGLFNGGPSPGSPAGPARRIGRLAAGLTAAWLLGACQAQGPGEPEAAIGALRARITSEIGAAACDTDAQCHTLAVGERPCGGPEAWLPYAAEAGRTARLEAWAATWRQWRREQQAQSGLMSTCQVLPDPGARCVRRRCQLPQAAALR